MDRTAILFNLQHDGADSFLEAWREIDDRMLIVVVDNVFTLMSDAPVQHVVPYR
jgi:hypothetical protein